MVETYSLAVTGCSAGQVNQLENIKIGDSSALPADLTLAMQQGTQILCKNPDGSQSWYVLDAERSTPSIPVLRAV